MPKPPADLWDRFAELTAPKVPEGAITSDDYAAHFKVGLTTARERLRRLVNEGKAKRFKLNNRIFYTLS